MIPFKQTFLCLQLWVNEWEICIMCLDTTSFIPLFFYLTSDLKILHPTCKGAYNKMSTECLLCMIYAEGCRSSWAVSQMIYYELVILCGPPTFLFQHLHEVQNFISNDTLPSCVFLHVCVSLVLKVLCGWLITAHVLRLYGWDEYSRGLCMPAG